MGKTIEANQVIESRQLSHLIGWEVTDVCDCETDDGSCSFNISLKNKNDVYCDILLMDNDIYVSDEYTKS